MIKLQTSHVQILIIRAFLKIFNSYEIAIRGNIHMNFDKIAHYYF